MRGFSPQINILFAILAAAGLIPALGLPWFAGAMDTNDGHQGQIELMGEAIGRWFTASGTTSTGADVLTSGETALLAVGAATVLLVLLMLIPGTRATMRGIVKLVPLAAPVIVLVQIVSQTHRADVEPRYGSFVALALAVFLASAAGQAAELREHKPAAQPYRPGATPPLA